MISDETILEARGLTKEFGGFIAVNDISLKIKRGSIHALIGPNGAGKTTLFNLLTIFLPASQGSILFNGEDITKKNPADVARKGLVRSFQISSTYANLTVLENVKLGLQQKYISSFNFWKSSKYLDALDPKAKELIESVGLSSYVNQKAGDLPYGRKRALEIAGTLALDPEIMLLDEPTAGMGHEDVDKISNLIKSAAMNRTVLVVEHNLAVVSHLADFITVLQRGKILAEGNYADISNNVEVREAYMGTVDD